jgi:Uma2 family endonuclease
MSASTDRLPKQHMTVDQFLVWGEQQPGRHELDCGQVFATAPERAGHAVAKGRIYGELARAVKAANVPCHVMPDGMTVRITDDTAHEPDALVYCGAEVHHDALEITEPMILVEVHSPSTGRYDAATKLPNYFSLPSVKHYLIVDPRPGRHAATLHSRRADGTILTTIFRGGAIPLDPPGLQLSFEAFFSN